jgi:hypothetical protein
MNLRILLIIGLSFTALATVYAQSETIGSDSNGAWRTSTHTITISHDTNSDIIVQVITNRITQEEFHWRQQIALVQIGMRRGDVEKILPPHTQPDLPITGGGGYLLSYGLDSVWRVSMWCSIQGLRSELRTNNFAETKVLDTPLLSKIPVVETPQR